jgi:hypothetical protein
LAAGYPILYVITIPEVITLVLFKYYYLKAVA